MSVENKRVAIICYSFSDGFAYLEQKLAETFSLLGFQVLVICSTANRVDSKTLIHVSDGEYHTNGYTVCRLPFITGGSLPDHKIPIILGGMYKKLCEFNPDIIYHMSISAINLLSVRRFIKKKKDTRLFLDNHASMLNSANNAVSKYVLHGCVYKPIVKLIDKYVSKYFYVGYGEKIFMNDFYKIPKAKSALYSLGDFILSDDEYLNIRKEKRSEMQLDVNDIAIIHSGKFTRRKKTIEIINMMIEITKEFKCVHFYLVGEVQDKEIENAFRELITNNNTKLHYLGWMKSDALKKQLCGSDIYIQYEPSSTFQTAMCCRCIGITGNKDRVYDVYPESTFIKVKTIGDMKDYLRGLIESKQLGEVRRRCYSFACENMDYREEVKSKILDC